MPDGVFGYVPGQRLEIDPAQIGFLQFPEFHKLGRRAPDAPLGWAAGEWDSISPRMCFWGARYEGGRNQAVGMVPLENYLFMTALKARFLKGAAWADTEWCQWMARTGPSRYNAPHKIERRIEFLDQLYRDCLAGDYRMDGDDLPRINVGRFGRIAIEDGRHRICVAKAAGLRRIAVRVNVAHQQLAMQPVPEV